MPVQPPPSLKTHDPAYTASPRARDVEFCVLVEQGLLEAQGLLLCESIRRFAGAYSPAAITAISPRPSQRPCRRTLRELDRFGVEYVELDVTTPCPHFGPSFKIHAVAHMARRPGPPILVQIDSDTLFLAEPELELAGADVAARPVDVKGICTAGQDDPLDKYWRTACAVCGVEYQRMPSVVTTVDRQTVRACYNGGFVVVRRSSGVLERTEEFFLRLVRSDLKPLAGSSTSLISQGGTVSANEAGFWGTGQSSLSLAITAQCASVRILPDSYNVPIHVFDRFTPYNAELIHVHYHWLCLANFHSQNPLLDGRIQLPAQTLDWLNARLPLDARCL